MDEFGLQVPIDLPVRRLSALQRAQIELLGAYLGEQDIVLLDNLGRFLSVQEIDHLMNFVERLRARGMTFIWLGNCESQMTVYADRTLVISHGRPLRSFLKGTLDGENLYRLLTGIRPEQNEVHFQKQRMCRHFPVNICAVGG